VTNINADKEYNMETATDYNLTEYANDIAQEIFEEYPDSRDDAFDMAWQPVDGSEWVIYHHKAHEVCAACNTYQGEYNIEDMGGFPEGSTYDSMASMIAYSEILARVNVKLNDLYEGAE
jgi:hypothetical protein